MALFIALVPRSRQLEEVSKVLVGLGFEPPPLYHVTIVFLGDLSGIHMHRLLSRLDSLEASPPRILRVIGVDALPPHKCTNIVLLLEDRGLSQLRSKIIDALGIEPRNRYSDFIPHLTIARARRILPLETVERALEETRRFIESSRMKYIAVESLAAIESRRGAYRVVKVIRRVE